MRFVGFIGPSYTSQSVNVDCQRCVNLYPEMDSLGTGKEREVASLVPTPGLNSLLTLPTGPVRALWTASNGQLYAVGGQFLYSISSSWGATELGALNSSTGPVSLADNGIQLVLVDGTWGYSFTFATSTYAQIVDINFPGSTQVAFQDGYFIFNQPGTQQFYCSDLYAVSFTALNSGKVEGNPDSLVGQISCQQNVYFFGTESTEIYYDAGTTPCPFTRIQGAMIQVGCASAFSIARLESVVYWLGGDETGDGIVYRMNGYQPERISTPAIEAVIRSAGSAQIANARAWTYQQGGHHFYCLNIPSISSTWVYDASTNFWHERTFKGSWGFERHRADCSALAYGKNLVGDYATGNVYSLEQSVNTDNATPIVRMRTAPHLSNDMTRVFHLRFQLDLETGVGLSSGQGSDPQVMLQWSDDSGHSWSNEKWASFGKIGETKTRVIFRRLGSSRDRVYRVMISDPVKVVLIGAEVDTEQGSA